MGGPAVCDPNTTTCPPATSSQPASGGLKEQWNLKEPPSLDEATTSDQDKKFLESFKATMDPANKCLQYTVANAEQSKHDACVIERDNFYTNFQATRAKIGKLDEAAAKSEIDAFLNLARGFAGRTTQFKQQTETSLNNWKKREPEYDKAVGQIEELEKWDDKKAPEFRTSSNIIQSVANDRKYDEAVKSLGELQPKMAPVYEEYLKQKAAKEYCEAKWNPIKDRVEAALAAEAPTEKLKTPQQQLRAAKGDMENGFSQKDYVGSKAPADQLQPALEQFESASKEQKEAKEYYDSKWNAIKSRVETALAQEAPTEKIKTPQQQVKTAKEEMDAAVAKSDYPAAKAPLDRIIPALEQFEQADKEFKEAKAYYESKWNPIRDRVEKAVAAEAPTEKLSTPQQQLKTHKDEMDKAVAQKDYVTAKPPLDQLQTPLEKFEQADKEYQEAKQAFEKEWPPIKQTVENAANDGIPVENIPAKDKLKVAKQEVETAVNQKDYVAAKAALDRMPPLIQEYEKAAREYNEIKKAYETEWTALKPEVEAALAETVQADKTKQAQQELAKVKGEMENAAGSNDFPKAKSLLDQIRPRLEDFNKALKEEKSSVRFFKPKFSVGEKSIESDANAEIQISVMFENASELAADATYEYQWNIPVGPPAPGTPIIVGDIRKEGANAVYSIKTEAAGNQELKYLVVAKQGQDEARWEVPESTSVTVKKPEMSVTDVGAGPFHPDDTTIARFEIKNVKNAKGMLARPKCVLECAKTPDAVSDNPNDKAFETAWEMKNDWESENSYLITLTARHAGEGKIEVEFDFNGTILKHTATVRCESPLKKFIDRLTQHGEGAAGMIGLKVENYFIDLNSTIDKGFKNHLAIGNQEKDKFDKSHQLLNDGTGFLKNALDMRLRILGLLLDQTIHSADPLAPTAAKLEEVSKAFPGFKDHIKSDGAGGLDSLALDQAGRKMGNAFKGILIKAKERWINWAKNEAPKNADVKFDPVDEMVGSAKLGDTPVANLPAIPAADDYERVCWQKWLSMNPPLRVPQDGVPDLVMRPYTKDGPIQQRLRQLGVAEPSVDQ